MSRIAYEELSRSNSSARLELPLRHFGHELPSLGNAAMLIILAACSGLIFLLVLLVSPTATETFVYSIRGVSLLVFLAATAGAILVIRKVNPQRELARERQRAARSAYIREKLLPFAATAYGITELKDPSTLLRGGLSEALLAGEPATVVVLEDKSGVLRLGDGSRAKLIEDGQSSGGGDALPVVLFPYSLDHHSATGSGSLHSSSDGGSFDADSGGDGGGDGGGGGGGD